MQKPQAKQSSNTVFNVSSSGMSLAGRDPESVGGVRYGISQLLHQVIP